MNHVSIFSCSCKLLSLGGWLIALMSFPLLVLFIDAKWKDVSYSPIRVKYSVIARPQGTSVMCDRLRWQLQNTWLLWYLRRCQFTCLIVQPASVNKLDAVTCQWSKQSQFVSQNTISQYLVSSIDLTIP